MTYNAFAVLWFFQLRTPTIRAGDSPSSRHQVGEHWITYETVVHDVVGGAVASSLGVHDRILG